MQHSQNLCFSLPRLCWVSANLSVLSPFCFYPFENFSFKKPSLFCGGRAAKRGKSGWWHWNFHPFQAAATSCIPAPPEQGHRHCSSNLGGLSFLCGGKWEKKIHPFLTLRHNVMCFHVGWMNFLVSLCWRLLGWAAPPFGGSEE